MLIDDTIRVQRTLARRFFFHAHRAVGTDDPEWVEVRRGKFSETLAPVEPRIHLLTQPNPQMQLTGP